MHAAALGELSEQDRDRSHRVGDHDLTRGQRPPVSAQALPRQRQAQTDLAVHAVRVEGDDRHAGLDRGDHQRVVEQVLAAEAAALHPLERDLLGRRPALVRVDPDLPEEDPVGPRDRLLAQVHGLGAREAVAHNPQPLAHLARAAPRARLQARVVEGELGELALQLGIDPALLDLELGGHFRSPRAEVRSSASLRSTRTLVSLTFPPRSANTVVGQSPTR